MTGTTVPAEPDHRQTEVPIRAEPGELDKKALIENGLRSGATPNDGVYGLFPFPVEGWSDIQQIAASAAELISQFAHSTSAVAVLEPDGGRLKLIAEHQNGQATATGFAELVPSIVELEPEGSLESIAMNSTGPVLFPSDNLAPGVHSQMFGHYLQETGGQSIVMLPLTGRTGALGIIAILDRHSAEALSDDERTTLMDIARRAALAIENCLLWDTLQAEVKARRSAARALNLSEQRFRSIFESTSLGIKILDLDGNIVETNAAYQRIIGYTESEVLGRRFYDFLHPADVSRAVSVFHQLANSGATPVRFQHRAIHKSGTVVWLNAIFSGVRKGGGDDRLAFIVSVVEDITDQKLFEAEMAELKSRLQSTMELERLRLAHELHDGPMQDLYSVIYELEELRAKTDAHTSEALKAVSDNVHAVLDELRTTAKELRPPTISQFGLEKSIRSYVGDLREKYPTLSVQLALAHDHQILPEEVRLALFRVFQHSLINVIRHAEASEVRVFFSFDAEDARLEISDNGKGFPVPASWIDFARKGHYGLAGAAERAQALGGVFGVESRPGGPTTVRAVIPWKDHAG